MRILILCSSSHEGVYCEHALVNIDLAKKEQMLVRREAYGCAKVLDDDLYTFTYWDGTARFYENLNPEEHLDAEALAKLDVDEWVVLPDGVELAEPDPIRTDGDCLVIDDVGFAWEANDKYCDAHFATRRLPYQVLDACVA